MGASLGVDYAVPGPFTDLSSLGSAAGDLPDDIPGLVRAIQGWMIHPFHAHRYGYATTMERQAELQIRTASGQLARVLELDGSALDEPRPPEKRVVGNCRHFATMLTALLRLRGVPARARCGFGAYFTPGKLEDHWVCEVWDELRDRWVLVDAQIDDIQREGMGITVDTLDLPRDAFWVAGQAWKACRSGAFEPSQCGILDMWGLWFVRANVVRDVASLVKVELLPWDGWGLSVPIDNDVSPADLAMLDRAAACTAKRPPDLAELQRLYADPAFGVPSTISSWVDGKDIEVRLPELGT